MSFGLKFCVNRKGGTGEGGWSQRVLTAWSHLHLAVYCESGMTLVLFPDPECAPAKESGSDATFCSVL